MEDLVLKLKSLKIKTQTQYDDTIQKYSNKEVLKELKEAGISKEELTENEFNELLAEKIKESKSFAKGTMVAGGVFLFLDLLG